MCPPPIHVFDVLAQGGCSIVVVFLAIQFLFMVWCVFVGSCCVGEAQQFSSAKGLLNVAIAIGVPLVIFAAAVVAHGLAT